MKENTTGCCGVDLHELEQWAFCESQAAMRGKHLHGNGWRKALLRNYLEVTGTSREIGSESRYRTYELVFVTSGGEH